MNKTRALEKWDWIILGIIILVAFALRMYHYDTPLADYHSWRQVDTAAVARNYTRNGINLLNPHYDDLSSIQSGLDNPTGLRLVDFPLYNATFALLYKLMPFISVESWGRIVSALGSLVIISIIYYLCFKEAGKMTAIASALVYAIFPYFVFFSRTVLPETSALTFAMISILFLYFYVEDPKQSKQPLWYTLSALTFTISLLIKPTTIFYSIAIFFLFVRKYQWNVLKRFDLYLFFAIAFIPTAIWRYYINKFPYAVPGSSWLIMEVNTFEGRKNIFFKPAFFRWIFFERINNIILGGYMTVFFIIGVISKHKNYLLTMLGISGFVYLFTFQGGNVQHEYYQTILFPALAIFTGMGIAFPFQNKKLFLNQVLVGVVIVGLTGLSLFFSYYKVKDYYGIPNDLIQVAKVVDTLTNPDDKIITDRLGDTTLLYLMDRKGSPAIYKDLNEMKNEGYKYVVTQNQDTVKDIKKRYGFKTVFENDKFALFTL
jgi:hypothetical protein